VRYTCLLCTHSEQCQFASIYALLNHAADEHGLTPDEAVSLRPRANERGVYVLPSGLGVYADNSMRGAQP
jgi:hypothetical protein